MFRKYLVLIVALTLMLTSSIKSSAQDDAISLREAITETLLNNPQIRKYNLRNEALDGELLTAGLKPSIRVSTEVENVIGTGDLKWFQGSELTLALSQVIELGDQRDARRNVVGRRQSLLAAEQQVQELELLGETTKRFIELAAAGQQVGLLSRSTALARETHATVSQRVSVGRAPEAELARATAALRLAELAEESAQFSINAARVRLSSTWGELEPDFNRASANLLEMPDTDSIDAILDRLENNPAILVFADEERLRQAQLREVQSRINSEIEVGAGIRYLAGLNDSAFTVQASMPLFSKRRSTGAIATAQANLRLVESDRALALLRISSQLISLNQQRLQAENEVRVIQDVVLPQLVIAMDETREAFDNGRYGYVELSAAQKDLLDAEFTLVEAAARAHQLAAEIERLSGESITELNNGDTQ